VCSLIIIQFPSLPKLNRTADIKLEPDKAVTKVQDKFMLHLGEEEALKNFESLLNEISSWAAVLDRLHAAAQYFRT
jgi:phosphatidylinositol 3-kinase